MKISLVAFAIFAVVAASAAGALASGRALATTSHQTTTKTVKIAMHDPGCHWFMVHGKYAKTDVVKANRVKLINQDEATLKVASSHGVQRIAVGKSLVVGQGAYRITMVGQAPDDNHLRLTVN